MIENIISFVNGRIEQLDLFERIFGFVELVQKNDGVYPYEYNGNGQFKPTTNFDWQKGLIYHREISPFREGVADGFNNINVISRTYFLRCVAIFPRNFAKSDDQYSVDAVRSLLAASIGGPNTKNLSQSLSAKKSLINVSSGSIDRSNILENEFSGIPKELDQRFGVVAIDYDVEISIDKMCLLNSVQICE